MEPIPFLKAALVFVVLAYMAAGAFQGIQWHVQTLMPPPAKKIHDDMVDHSSDDYYAVREASIYGMVLGFPLLVAMAACAAMGATLLGVALVQWRTAFASVWFWATALPLLGFLGWFIPRLVRIFSR